MKKHVITATEAARSLSDVLNKVHYQGQSFEVKRGKEIIAKIIPASTYKQTMTVKELKEFFKHLPPLENEDKLAFIETIKEIRSDAEENPWD